VVNSYLSALITYSLQEGSHLGSTSASGVALSAESNGGAARRESGAVHQNLLLRTVSLADSALAWSSCPQEFHTVRNTPCIGFAENIGNTGADALLRLQDALFYRGGEALSNMAGGRRGGRGLVIKSRSYLYLRFPKCILRCSFAQTNFLAISAVFNVFVIDL